MLKRASMAAVAGLFSVLTACGSSSDDAKTPDAPAGGPVCTEGAPGCLGWVSCPAGFERDTSRPEAPDANSCRDIQPAGDCAPGTMPMLGSTECAPVGWSACPPGFTKAASGWGCDEVLPKAACTGATRESLGSTSCVPVGDCNAPFPPANAKLFVNAAYTDAQIDTTHFRIIGDAIAAAPAGSVIAVEAGTYTEGLGPTRAMTIVGRCAEKVRLVGTGLRYPGVFSRGIKGIVASGLTLEGHFQGIRAEGGGTITASDIVIESPRLSGIIAYQPSTVVTASRVVVRNAVIESGSASAAGATADAGGKLELTDAVLAGSNDVGLSATNATGESKTGSIATARRTVIRDTRPSRKAPAGSGAAVFDGCTIDLDSSVIMNTYGFGVLAEFAGAKANISKSVIRTTALSPSDEIAGGVVAYEESDVTLDSVNVDGNEQGGVYARGKMSLKVTGSVIQASKPQADGAFGMGLWADQGAKVEMSKTAIVDNAYYGMAAFDLHTEVHASGSLVRGTKRDVKDVLGRGLNVEDAASVTLEDFSLVGNGDESLFVRGGVMGKGRSHVAASRLIVRDSTSRKDGSKGDGIAVGSGALFELDTAAVVRTRRAGIIINDILGPDGVTSEATITHTIVRETAAAGDAQGKLPGIPLEGVGIATGGKLTLSASAIIGNVQFGVIFGGKNSAGSIESSLIATTAANASGDFGHGVVGVDGTNLLVKNTTILGNRIGAAFAASTATLAGVLVQKNSVGIHVQGGSQLQTAPIAPDEPTPDVIVVTDDSQFIDNDTRIGSGTVPLPSGPISSTDTAPKTPAKTK